MFWDFVLSYIAWQQKGGRVVKFYCIQLVLGVERECCFFPYGQCAKRREAIFSFPVWMCGTGVTAVQLVTPFFGSFLSVWRAVLGQKLPRRAKASTQMMPLYRANFLHIPSFSAVLQLHSSMARRIIFVQSSFVMYNNGKASMQQTKLRLEILILPRKQYNRLKFPKNSRCQLILCCAFLVWLRSCSCKGWLHQQKTLKSGLARSHEQATRSLISSFLNAPQYKLNLTNFLVLLVQLALRNAICNERFFSGIVAKCILFWDLGPLSPCAEQGPQFCLRGMCRNPRICKLLS